MKLLVVLVLSIVVTVLAENSLTHRGGAKHSDFPNQCYYKELDKPIPFGGFIKPIGECLKINCRDDFVLEFNSCPFYQSLAHCEALPQDLTKTWPDCCTVLKCKDESGEYMKVTAEE